MRVLTLTPPLFEDACRRLGELTAAAAPFDAVVSVRNGGTRVAETARMLVPSLCVPPHYTVTLRRPSSSSKDKLGAGRLAQLPVWLLDLMRMAESLWLRRKHKLSPQQGREFHLSDELLHSLASGTVSRVLVIDDAVDSGVTLRRVVESLHRADSNVEVITAVLTVTTPHPAIEPDIVLYARGTLLRCPWASDYNPRKHENKQS